MYVKTITDYLDMTVDKYPNKIGVRDEKKAYSFSEIKEKALRIATAIGIRDVFKKPIAIFLDKNVDCFTSIFGVAYSGNFYTIIDVGMPKERIKKILNTLQPEVVITDKKHEEDIRLIDSKLEALILEDLYTISEDYFLIKKLRTKIVDTDVLYILFTSGSTGDPKGVIISHRNVITYMEWSGEAFGFDDNTVFGSQTPFYFSMSVLDVFQTIRVGAELVIIPKKMFSLPGNLVTFIGENKINTIYWVPSALCQLANVGILDNQNLKCLKKVLFAGEVMPAKQLNMWRRALPDTLYANLFGPTEVTDICTYYILNREIADDESVPIGVSCDNMNVFIVDNKGKEVQGTQEGEMLVRGASVAYGYYKNPLKTKEAFVQNPLQNCYDEKVYKTGDIVHFNERGEMIYVSRKDFQIKHMGYRIELGEIETAASAVEYVDRAFCVYDSSNSEIVLFYVGNIEEKDIKKNLKKKVPKYMIPTRYIKIESMPLNLNGKIDRSKLKEML